jgi:DNA polymerase-3 subunit alpha
MSYVSVHNHTHYSNLRLLDCIIKPTDLIDKAYQLGLSAVAITDHEILSAHIEAIQHYKKNYKDKDFKLILGNEIYLTDDREMGSKYPHFLIMARNAEGHKALRELSSTTWSQSYFDRGLERVPTTKDELMAICKKYPNTLIATSACIGGELSQYILKLDRAEKAGEFEEITNAKRKIVEFVNFMRECFGEYFFFEIAPNTAEDQRLVNNRMKALAKFFNIPMLYATDSHYLEKEDRFIHKAFLNSKHGEREVDDFYMTAYMMTEQEVWEYLQLDFTKEEFDEMTANSRKILDWVEFYDLYKPQSIPMVEVKPESLDDLTCLVVRKYPHLNIMWGVESQQNNYWAARCIKALKQKNLFNEKYLTRLDQEAKELLGISKELNIEMTSYYNTMAKIIELVWEQGDSLVGVARGSATGFLSCYLLGITQLDPIKWKLPHWRHLTATRPELPDIDFDTQALRRAQILQAVKDFFGQDNVLNICTFGTEGPKSAVLTACRGLGIDSDVGLYLTGMIPQDRGFTWPVSDCLYGNRDKGRKAIRMFKQEMDKYPGLENIVLNIEGLVNKRSIHAAGVYIFNNGFTEMNALMKAPNGQPITQWDMNDSDYMGCLKYDFLTVEALDKIRVTLDLLIEDGQIENKGSLKATYDKYIHPDVLDYSQDIWKPSWSGSVINLFQFDTMVGGQAIKKVRPMSLDDAASANSLMRLMPLEDGTVLVDKYVNFKNNMKLWYSEVKNAKLTKQEVELLEPHYLPVYGVPNTQEDMMEILMNSALVGFSLEEANYARKIVGKKKMDEIPKLKKMIYQKSPCRKELMDYVYATAIEPQLGYSFSRNHTTPYTAIALQELNLYNKYDTLYWNTACLTVNAGASENIDDERSTDYAKIATAIGDMQSREVDISLPHINKSSFSFKPDTESQQIYFGLKGLANVGTDVISRIIEGRPYSSLADFMTRCPLSRTAMISLVKSGAFDKIETKDRTAIMEEYLRATMSLKKRVTLQNLPSLIEYQLLDKEVDFSLRAYEFNRYLKALCKKGLYYSFDSRALQFYSKNFDDKHIEIIDNVESILIKTWDKLYDKTMDQMRTWITKNKDRLLDELNNRVFQEEWDKYAQGNLASWEMDSVCFYYSFHELDFINQNKYGVRGFLTLPEEPKVEKVLNFGNKTVPIFETAVVAGTILGKDKIKATIAVMTTSGVVYTKFRPEQFAEYDKQISEKQGDGSKKILEKSWFKRGRKVLITGYRRGNEFVPKVYAHTATEPLYMIDDISENGELVLRGSRE